MKSERHHWWPEVVSRNWTDDAGFITWLLPSGQSRRLKPNKIGVIRDGHAVKLAPPGEKSAWDTSFESEFQRADGSFRGLIEWLDTLDRRQSHPTDTDADRFHPVQVSDDRLGVLLEGLISLAVRSPRTRELAVSLAEHLRGELPERERNALIGANLLHMHRTLVNGLGTSGKFVAIYSPYCEFIFGDGFFHNLTSMNLPYEPKLVVPLTPRITMLFVRTMAYRPDPKMMTIVFTEAETQAFNRAIQVYSREMLFYRDEKPDISEHFEVAKHLQFASRKNPIEFFMGTIPGVDVRRPFSAPW